MSRLKEYKFLIGLCGGYCDGFLKFKAEDEDIAYDMALNYVCEKLSNTFPELEIEVEVDLVEE